MTFRVNAHVFKNDAENIINLSTLYMNHEPPVNHGYIQLYIHFTFVPPGLMSERVVLSLVKLADRVSLAVATHQLCLSL